jgi:hypothetical protein
LLKIVRTLGCLVGEVVAIATDISMVTGAMAIIEVIVIAPIAVIDRTISAVIVPIISIRATAITHVHTGAAGASGEW